MDELWTRWSPTSHIFYGYDVLSVSYDHEKILITLEEEDGNNQICALFAQPIIAYRLTDETNRMRLTDNLIWQTKTYDYQHGSNFYIVENSSYIKSLAIQKPTFMHYAIHTANTVIDIITEQTPTIKTSIEK